MSIIKIIILFSVFLCTNSAHAASIGVKPKMLEFYGRVGQTIEKQVLIFNPSDEPAIYSLSAESQKPELRIEPKEFVLNPKEEKLVKVSLKKYYPTNQNQELSIYALPIAAGAVSAAPGIKLPLEIKVGFSRLQTVILAFCLSFLIVLILKIIGKTSKKKI